jgi:hypothetical protein
MKNVHLIPTDKPSRLVKFFTNKFHLCKEILPIVDEEQYQNIYITSDEEIKVNDYITDGYLVWKWKDDSSLLGRKKVITTTDQDLIKDGVQAIDDEFLEWFVKNPSCEEVEVEKEQVNNKYGSSYSTITIYKYKIIIPNEEPKQELPYWFETQGWEDFNKLVENNFGAKPKQERMYSEEEMIKFADFVATYPDKNRNHKKEMLHAKSKYDGAERTIDLLQLWIEQFKKKQSGE